MAGNATEARLVQTAARASSGRIVEGFHYLHHPVNVALRELVVGGELGDVQRVELVLATPAPASSDPRWSLELGGGATMDLGCYVLSAARHVGRWIGQSPEVLSAEVELRAPGLDAAMAVELAYPGGVLCSARWDMAAPERKMTWTVVGSAATATSPAFAVPALDPRLIVTRNGKTEEQRLGAESSYTYQLAAVAQSLQDGGPLLVDVDDAVANAELTDACYRASGL
jgi:predicted dehydrogenase